MTITYAVTINGATTTSHQQEFQDKYPTAFKHYQFLCKLKKITAGKPVILNDKENQILLLPVYDNELNSKAIKDCIKYIQQWHNDLDIKEIRFQKFDDDSWNETKQLIHEYLKDEDIKIEME